MNKFVNLCLIGVGLFLTSCTANGRPEEVKEYNVTYLTTQGAPSGSAPTVTGPNTIKSNEEATVTVNYGFNCTISAQESVISSFDNISIKDYVVIDEDNGIASFTIYNATDDAVSVAMPFPCSGTTAVSRSTYTFP